MPSLAVGVISGISEYLTRMDGAGAPDKGNDPAMLKLMETAREES